jgi:DNA-directed RNA polymerase subunit beta'
MNQELSTNPFNPVAPVKTFDEIKISLASPERIVGSNMELLDAEGDE